MNDTYNMEFICKNCGTKIIREVPKGERAQGKGGECPYCGTKDNMYSPFAWYRPDMNPFKD